jgi:hypothetical protein
VDKGEPYAALIKQLAEQSKMFQEELREKNPSYLEINVKADLISPTQFSHEVIRTLESPTFTVTLDFSQPTLISVASLNIEVRDKVIGRFHKSSVSWSRHEMQERIFHMIVAG